MSHDPVLDQSDNLSGEPVALAGHEVQDVNTGPSVDDRYRLRQQDTNRLPALRWTGPVAFAKGLGRVRGVERDFGNCWGPNGDQRVTYRMELGGNPGLLYVHDPTWDEYAILATDVTLPAVEDACTRSRRLGTYSSVEDLAAALPPVPAARPSRGPER